MPGPRRDVRVGRVAGGVSLRAVPFGFAAALPGGVLSTAGFPDTTNTGVPAGVVLTGSGPVTTTADNQVIDSLDITGQLTVKHNNVTVKRCRITTNQIDDAAVKGSGTGATIQDCEVLGGSGQLGSYNGIQLPAVTILRCNLHNFENCVEIMSGSTVQDTYIHDLWATYPGAAPHYDGIECQSGSNMTVHHCHIVNTNINTSCINFSGDGGNITNITITDNLLDGGDFCIYLDPKSNSITGVTLDDNRFGRDQQYGVLYDKGAVYTHTPAGNVYDNDGSPAI